MIYGITYSSGNMDRSAELCRQSMLKHGAGVAMTYCPNDISQWFKKFNSDIWGQPRGASYWLWKAFIIYRSLCDSEDDSITLYMDAGVELTGSIHHIIDAMDQDIFLFSNGHPHYDWCKRKVLDAMLPNWTNYWKDRKSMPQVQASVIIVKNTQFARGFIKEWLLWCQVPGFIDDSPSNPGESEQAGFQEHRHDQAILTCLAYKYGIKQHWWPTQYSQHLQRNGDNYPAIFNHHRKRNKGCGFGDSEWPD